MLRKNNQATNRGKFIGQDQVGITSIKVGWGLARVMFVDFQFGLLA